MRKYLQLTILQVKQELAYRGDTLLSSLFSVLSVPVYYLLWHMLIPQGGTLSGYTLPEMVRYTVLCQALTPLLLANDEMWAFSDEIRTGRFARHLYTPVHPLGVFCASSIGRVLPQTAFTLAGCCLWSVLLRSATSPLSPHGLLLALPLILLSVTFVLLMNYLLTCLAFRLTDLTGVILLRTELLRFFSGAIAPLEILFGGAPTWSPLYYLADYPANLMMGRPCAPVGTAFFVLGLSAAFLLLLCLTVSKSSRRLFEGVGA